MQARHHWGKRWAAAGLAAASLHLALLPIVLIARGGLRLPTAAFSPDVQLDLERKLQPQRQGERPHARRVGVRARAAPPSAGPAPHAPERLPSLTSTRTVPHAGAPATASLPGSSDLPAIANAWRVRPRGAPLRMFGSNCRRAADLTTAEQASCDQAAAEAKAADPAPVDRIPALKRGYYDAVVAKRDNDRSGAFKTMADMQQARGMAGRRTHFDITVGYHCSFKFGAGAAEANRAAGKRIGFPPCPLHAPGAEPAPP